MPYIGKEPVAGNFVLLDSITTSATATYALTKDSVAYSPESARNMIVSLNGVTQAPETAFTVSGSNITFSSALTSSDVIDYILVLGDVLSVGTPSDGTVGTSQMSYPLDNFSSTGIDDNATSTAITIDASENVGIGTTSPDSILHLSGASNSKIIIEDSASPRGNYIGINSSDNLVIAADEDNLGSSSNIQFRVDATERMRIDSSGRLLINTSSSRETSGGERQLQIEGTNGVTSSASITRNQNGTAGPNLTLGKTRAGSVGGNTAVIDGDDLGSILFVGADGTDLNTIGASILSEVDGTPSSNVMPANLIFNTNQGGSGVTEAMRISSNGQLKIGGTTNSPANVQAVLFGTGNASLIYDTGHTGLHINNENASAGIDNYGAGISFGRFASNSDDQSAAIVPVQTASDQDHMGIAFLTHNTNTRANPLVEKMRLDADGNLGLGTDDPSRLLHLKATDSCLLQLQVGNTTGNCQVLFGDSGSTTVGKILYNHTGNSMSFEANAAERMRIDSSGNLLLGRTSTPSGIQAGSLCINFDIHHQDAAGNDRLLYDRSSNLLGNAGTNVTCATLSKSSGSFKIEHPLPEKTDTHYLVHSFVEAPQADNIYRGTVDLVDGTATVNLDTAGRMSEGTFVLLNTNIQCFTTNESGWIAVKGFVSGNILTITAQESCEDTVSWLVVGERCDQHMIDTDWTNEAGRIITEPLKGA